MLDEIVVLAVLSTKILIWRYFHSLRVYHSYFRENSHATRNPHRFLNLAAPPQVVHPTLFLPSNYAIAFLRMWIPAFFKAPTPYQWTFAPREFLAKRSLS